MSSLPFLKIRTIISSRSLEINENMSMLSEHSVTGAREERFRASRNDKPRYSLFPPFPASEASRESSFFGDRCCLVIECLLC